MNVKVTGDSRGDIGNIFNVLMESLPPPCSIKIMMTSSTPIRARIGVSPLRGTPRSIFFRLNSSPVLGTDSSESVVIFWSKSHITLISSWGFIPSLRAARKQKGRAVRGRAAVSPAAGSFTRSLPAAKLQGGLN